MPALIQHTYPTPLGDLVALFSTKGLCLLEFGVDTKGLSREWRDVERHAGAAAVPGEDARTRALGEQIAAYFKGELTHFDVPLDLVGTAFQQQVWQALNTIPYGETRTYGDIALQIGNPKGARAVGGACNKNPLWIAVPCHRVLGAGGSLTGYAYGTGMKQTLLALEQSNKK